MIIILVLFLFSSIQALPQGAPTSVCETMVPFHGGGIPPQYNSPPFGVLPRRQNGVISVIIRSPIGVPFQGFLLQARTPNRELLGNFESPNAGHTIDCAEPGDSLTHTNTDKKEEIEAIWYPPQNYEGPVIFNATIAQTYSTFWVGIESPPIEIGKRSVKDDIPLYRPNRPRTTTPPYYSPEPGREASTDFDPFYSGCTSTKLCFGSPAGCVNSRNCKSATAITVVGDKYDFEMKAIGNAGWVGVGLSDDAKMGDDSVIECIKRGSSVAAYMSFTTAPPNSYGATRLSNPQLGIQLLNGSVIDDTIYCKVRRDAKTRVNGRIFDLINEKYNILVASGSGVKPSSVEFHDLSFLASGEKQSLSDVSSVAAASKLLLRLHGCFMLAAWVGTASIGILLARYYRKTWVESSLCGKDLWFAWHRMFMCLTWLLTIVAFILIFVELKAWSRENNPHAICGTVTTILCFFQPIGAYFRPHPKTPKRPIFDWLHWLVGNTAHIIAILTIFFAVRLTKAELPEFVDWILVGFVAFHVIVHLILSIMGCVSEKSSEKRITSFPMKDLAGSGRNSTYAERNSDAPYSGFRRVLLAIYIIINIIIVIALIIIAALAPIEESWENLRHSMMNAK